MHELYYPEFEVPSTRWIKLALLTKEKVSTIVPYHYQAEVSPGFRTIMEETDLFSYQDIAVENYSAVAESTELMISLMSDMLNRNINHRDLFIHKLESRLRNASEFEYELVSPKLSAGIVDYAIDKGFGFRGDQDRYSLHTSKEFAYLYMNFLTDKIVANSEEKIYKTTSISKERTIQVLLSCLSNLRSNEEKIKKMEYTDIAISNLIPVNINELTYRQIINIRNNPRYRDNINSFTNIIEQLVDRQLSLSEFDVKLFNQHLEELMNERNDIIAEVLGLRALQVAASYITISLDNHLVELASTLGFGALESRYQRRISRLKYATDELSQARKIINNLRTLTV